MSRSTSTGFKPGSEKFEDFVNLDDILKDVNILLLIISATKGWIFMLELLDWPGGESVIEGKCRYICFTIFMNETLIYLKLF